MINITRRKFDIEIAGSLQRLSHRKGRGWFNHPVEHDLARQGIRTSEIKKSRKSIDGDFLTNPLPKVTEIKQLPIQTHEDLYDYALILDRIDFPDFLTEEEKYLYLQDVVIMPDEEERYYKLPEVLDEQSIAIINEKWMDWKEPRRGKKTAYIINKIGTDEFYITTDQVPPSTFRWVFEDELESAKHRVRGLVTKKGSDIEYKVDENENVILRGVDTNRPLINPFISELPTYEDVLYEEKFYSQRGLKQEKGGQKRHSTVMRSEIKEKNPEMTPEEVAGQEILDRKRAYSAGKKQTRRSGNVKSIQENEKIKERIIKIKGQPYWDLHYGNKNERNDNIEESEKDETE